jgi:hypothetical protein
MSAYSQSAPVYYPQEVWTSIETPSSGTASGDQYTLTLNVFDSDNYFDQIGLSSDYGCSACGDPYNDWSVAFEQGTYGPYKGIYDCGNTGDNGRDGYDSPGLQSITWYTFAMKLNDGVLTFELFAGSDTITGTPLWTHSDSDPATYFLVESEDTICHGGGLGSGYYGLSFFEEVESIGSRNPAQQVPRWDFEFFDTSGEVGTSSIQIPDSNLYPSQTGGPPEVPHIYFMDYTAGTYVVRVANEAQAIWFNQDLYSINPVYGFTANGNEMAIGSLSPTDYCIKNACNLAVTCSWPGGWQGTCSWSTVPGTLTYSATAPLGAQAGVYYTVITSEVPISSYWETTTWIWYIYVL